MKNVRFFTWMAALSFASCTPGGVTPSGSAGATPQRVVAIDVNLALNKLAQTPAGPALGFAPEVATVTVGDGVRFVNSDNTQHTASFVTGVTFPDSSPLQFTSTSPSKNVTLSSTDWSSGAIAAGASSQVFVVDKPGVYLFGCFYHYSGKMRGEIVAQ
ncbi:MAG: plastocyanin/azurin family copper-binding protein [Candidatus Eremiobacteraeota bacterium]|nr:plastocyanin/azurin family copper-binding protein [Candidatus Eremiobacteraeota bacterium]